MQAEQKKPQHTQESLFPISRSHDKEQPPPKTSITAKVMRAIRTAGFSQKLAIRACMLQLFCLIGGGSMCFTNVSASNIIHVMRSDLQGDGVTVYNRLREIHASALTLGPDTRVVYPTKTTVNIEIPLGATTIPLTNNTDFCDCTFLVKNTSKDNFFLFSLDRRSDLQDNETVNFSTLASAARKVNVSGNMIDSGDFSSVPALSHGHKLLYVYDPNVWSIGGVSGTLEVYRRDIIHIADGQAQNKPIRPYAEASNLMCFWDEVTGETSPTFENLTFTRTASSTQQTYLLKACGQIGLQVRHLNINTPREDTILSDRPRYLDDQCLYIRHSVNILLENICVNGTYSRSHQHGYAFRMINLANTTLRNVQGDGAWGVQCGFFLNTVTLDGCTLNRFDCHCYCADFTYRNCTFKTDMTHYSSESCSCQVACAYGYMHFAHCRFVDARPMIVSPMYSGGHSGFELSYHDCVFDILPKYYYLVEGLTFDDTEDSRALPNLYMRDCIIDASRGTDARRYYLYHFNNQKNEGLYKDTVQYLNTVSLENVKVLTGNQQAPVWLCNKKLNYQQHLMKRVLNCPFDSINYPSK